MLKNSVYHTLFVFSVCCSLGIIYQRVYFNYNFFGRNTGLETNSR